MALDDRPRMHRVSGEAGNDEEFSELGPPEAAVAADRFDRDWSGYGCHAASVRKLLIHSAITMTLALAMALMLAATFGWFGRFEVVRPPRCPYHEEKRTDQLVGLDRAPSQGDEGYYHHA